MAIFWNRISSFVSSRRSTLFRNRIHSPLTLLRNSSSGLTFLTDGNRDEFVETNLFSPTTHSASSRSRRGSLYDSEITGDDENGDLRIYVQHLNGSADSLNSLTSDTHSVPSLTCSSNTAVSDCGSSIHTDQDLSQQGVGTGRVCISSCDPSYLGVFCQDSIIGDESLDLECLKELGDSSREPLIDRKVAVDCDQDDDSQHFAELTDCHYTLACAVSPQEDGYISMNIGGSQCILRFISCLGMSPQIPATQGTTVVNSPHITWGFHEIPSKAYIGQTYVPFVTSTGSGQLEQWLVVVETIDLTPSVDVPQPVLVPFTPGSHYVIDTFEKAGALHRQLLVELIAPVGGEQIFVYDNTRYFELNAYDSIPIHSAQTADRGDHVIWRIAGQQILALVEEDLRKPCDSSDSMHKHNESTSVICDNGNQHGNLGDKGGWDEHWDSPSIGLATPLSQYEATEATGGQVPFLPDELPLYHPRPVRHFVPRWIDSFGLCATEPVTIPRCIQDFGPPASKAKVPLKEGLDWHWGPHSGDIEWGCQWFVPCPTTVDPLEVSHDEICEFDGSVMLPSSLLTMLDEGLFIRESDIDADFSRITSSVQNSPTGFQFQLHINA